MMKKLKKKSQILMLVIMATLLFLSPLISTSLRPKYLYFIFNLLIIALAAEAGLLPNSLSTNHHQYSSASKVPTTAASVHNSPPMHDAGAANHMEKPSSSTTSLKSSPPMPLPTLFFIAGRDQADDHDHFLQHSVVEDDHRDDDGAGVGEVISGQELFTKAETFIGNFYKQLREDSWNRIMAASS